MLGVLAALQASIGSGIWPLAALGALLCLVYRHCEYRKLIMAVCLLLFLGGYYRTAQMNAESESYAHILKTEERARIQGNIYKKETKNGKPVVYLNHVILQAGGDNYETAPVLVYLADNSYPIGKTIVLEGQIKQLRHASNEGGYDEKQYYHTLHIDYHFYADSVCGVYGKQDRVREMLFQIREKLKQNYINVFSPRNAGIMSAMLIGDKDLLEDELNDEFRMAGVSHMLVISGMHISIIGMGIWKCFRKRCSYCVAAISSFQLLLLYISMIGMGLSAVRAFIMFAVMMAAKVLGRSYDVMSGLSVALAILLWENPYRIEHAGLQFSVAAIIGAVVVGKTICEIREWKKWTKAVIISVSIQIMTLPLVAYYYYEIPVYSVIVNLLAVPMLSVVLLFGILCSVTGCVSLPLAQAVAFPIERIWDVICLVVEGSHELPGAMQIVGRMPVRRMAVYYGVLFVVLYYWNCSTLNHQSYDKKFSWTLAGMVSCLTLLVGIPQQTAKNCAFLDVGQGDGTYLQSENGIQMFIDGGSSDVKEAGKYRILPFLKYNGVRSIDYWFVSHYDSDHVSGLFEVIENGYKIHHLILPGERRENKNYQKLMELAEVYDISYSYMKQGDVLHLGEERITCLLAKGEEAEDENSASLILYYEGLAFDGLFMGDAGTDEETEVLALLEDDIAGDVPGTVPGVDDGETGAAILKAGHHGSDTASSAEWLNYWRPSYAVISCARDNSYGHPGKEAIERIEESGSSILYTMESGQISVEKRKEEIWIKRYNQRGHV